HLLGIGHLKRAGLLVDAMAAAGLEVHVVAGGVMTHPDWFHGGVLHQLPALQAGPGNDFTNLVDDQGQPATPAHDAERKRLLTALAHKISPACVVIEHYPFGRRRFRHELAPLLKLWADRVPVLSSVRDILVVGSDGGADAARSEQTEKAARKAAWMVGEVNDRFAGVLVHADPHVITLAETFTPASQLAPPLLYTGYVTQAPAALPASPADRDLIVVAAGGGAVGGALMRTALHVALRPACGDRAAGSERWLLLTGPNLPRAERDALAAMVSAEVTGSGRHADIRLEPARDDYPSLLRAARASISQGGYNTMMDLLAAGTPAVLVPFEAKGETEQRLRCDRFARTHPSWQIVPENALDQAALSQALAHALAHGGDRQPETTAVPAAASTQVDTDGARRSAALVTHACALRDQAPANLTYWRQALADSGIGL
ncbi:MAG: glycosyltransferase, partial [Pseudomonadota bacterium]